MSTKLTLLVAALATATLATAACEQRSSDAVGRADSTSQPASSMKAQTTGMANQVAVATDDTAITAKVKAAILAEPGLKSLQINVDTKDATVTLTGNVDSDMMRDRAKQIAMSTEGVRNVVDNLTIKAS
jgi:hyperosmotically inducible protein